MASRELDCCGQRPLERMVFECVFDRQVGPWRVAVTGVADMTLNLYTVVQSDGLLEHVFEVSQGVTTIK